ncbi:DUF6624 domain-containing protein [Polaribacter porphyrae]|uniref:Uncharacterized protein n=1 Tax=Polaribacter porphyrae TaxID=1137780 RepID=A0A2S7WS13_9FLAO|nr:DUF6624 domain-containing protein [Polaribacter porphyrae]PQJ80101.1 hypothetical protein BTO18_13365 [Polaribacter porphyrae]
MKKIFFLFTVLITNYGFSQAKNIDSLQIENLKKELHQIKIEDQTLRFLLPDVTKRFGNKSDESKYIWSLIHKQDSICEAKVISILKKHGWLGKSIIGEDANQTLWLVVQHAQLKNQEKYISLLKKSVDKGESKPWHYAFLKDRILMRNGKKQIYGTQAFWDKKLGKMKIYPIKNPKNVNEKRKKLGLGTVEEHAKQNGYILND